MGYMRETKKRLNVLAQGYRCGGAQRMHNEKNYVVPYFFAILATITLQCDNTAEPY